MITHFGTDGARADVGRYDDSWHSRTQQCEVESLGPTEEQLLQDPDHAAPRQAGIRYAAWWGYVVIKAAVLVIGHEQNRPLKDLRLRAEGLVNAGNEILGA